ncbi:PorV/PorQ family protein [Membranicola marinus]|uniref:PorV/PorQ family protein n=1 Tax=Membranihabitans marinus TaxID=1227546 RepID=A0A953HMP6_9BACT|nr:PorV/PorQ family protein [Membranihabitans marinus]MBY5958809.1 PorV/PorQ family protein [Membranihabitans marinus]
MKIVKLWLGLLVFFGASSHSLAQQIYSNDFLNIGVGARSLAMGRAVVSTETSIQAAYWNPANLSTGDGPMQLSAMHAIWFAGVVNYDYLGTGFKLGSDGKSYGAVSMIRMGIDDIPNTLHLYGPDGRINYANIRSFSVADYAFLFTYGRQLGDSDWRVGGNVKVIRRVLGSFAKSWGGGLDLSVAYSGEDFRFGAVLRDATSTFNAWSYSFTSDEIEILHNLGNTVPESAQEVIRPSLSTGVSYKYNMNENLDATVALDADVTFDGRRNTLINTDGMSIEPHIGIELSSRNILFLRTGISSIQRRKKINNPTANEYFIQPNMGIGLQLGRIGIDYALAFLNENDGKSSLSHVFSAHYTLQSRSSE